MKKKLYLQPKTTLSEVLQERCFCASDLVTWDSNGLEGWTEDDEGEWS